MTLKTFSRLLLLELEEYWSFPIFEIVLIIAMFAVLNFQATGFEFSRFYAYVPTFLIFVIGALIPRSFAGSMNSREIVVFLSYPVKRWSILSAKFIVNIFVLSIAFSIAFLLNIALLALNPLSANLQLYAFIPIVWMQILFLSTAAMTISLLVKSETISALASILIFFGAEFSLSTFDAPYKYFTLYGSGNAIYSYLTARLSSPPPQALTAALAFPLLTTAFLLAVTFVYFQWIIQLD